MFQLQSRGQPVSLILVLALALGTIGSSLFYNGSQGFLYELALVTATGATCLALYRASGTQLSIGVPGMFLLAFLVWSTACIGWSLVPYVSLIELGSLGAGVAMYLTWRLSNGEDERLPTTTLALSLAGVLALAMVGQFLAGFPPDATFLNPNSSAALLNLFWPIAAVRFLGTSERKRMAPALLALVGLVLFAVQLTGSRGAALATLTALIILGAYGCLWMRQPRATLNLVLVATGALLFAQWATSDAGAASTLQTLAGERSAGQSRPAIWSATWDMIREAPWLGIGPGVFYLAYPAHRLSVDTSAGFFVHNDYLEFWLERGLVGLLLVVALGVVIAWSLARALRASRACPARSKETELIGITAALATIVVHSVVSYSLQLMPFLLVLGILIAEFERLCGHSAASLHIPVPRWRGRLLPASALAGLVLLATWGAGSHALYFHTIEQAQKRFTQGDFAEAADEFARARAVWGLPDVGWYLQANTHLEALRQRPDLRLDTKRQLARRAMELLDEAEARNPLRAKTPLIRGLLRANYPDLVAGDAAIALRRALELDPRLIEARYALSQLLEREGHIEAAYDLVRAGLKMRYRRGSNLEPLIRRARVLRNRSQAAQAPNASLPSPSLIRGRGRTRTTRPIRLNIGHLIPRVG